MYKKITNYRYIWYAIVDFAEQLSILYLIYICGQNLEKVYSSQGALSRRSFKGNRGLSYFITTSERSSERLTSFRTNKTSIISSNDIKTVDGISQFYENRLSG